MGFKPFSLFLVLALFATLLWRPSLLLAQTLPQTQKKDVIIAKEDKDFYLVAETCEALLPQITALIAWKKSLGKKTYDEPKINCHQSNPPTRVRVNGILPHQAKKYLGMRPFCTGPNCWNIALVLSGLYPHIRYSDDTEFTPLLQKHCRMKNTALEPLVPGDLVVIRSQGPRLANFEEVHAATYISEELIFTKNGGDRSAPYKFNSRDEVLSKYLVPQDSACRNGQLPTPPHCHQYTVYYQCTPQKFSQEELTAECLLSKAALHGHQGIKDIFPDLIDFKKFMNDEISCLPEGPCRDILRGQLIWINQAH